jgi:hypothetical protein
MMKAMVGVKGMAIAMAIGGVSLGACGGAAGNGKGTKEDLGKAVVEALTKKDPAGLIGLYASIDLLMTACPEQAAARPKLEERRAKHEEKVKGVFTECAGKADWSKAKILEVKGGETKTKESKCPAVVELKDIDVLAEVDGKKFRVNLDDPLQVDGKLYLFDRFRCETDEGDGAKVEPPPGETMKPAEPPVEKPAEVKPAEPPKPAEAAPGDLPEECKTYLSSYEKCVAAAPEPAREPLNKALAQAKSAWAAVPDKAMLGQTCKTMLDQTKGALGQLCPGVFQ